MGEIAQHNKIITEGIGDAAISMPSSFTSYISRHHTEARATLVHFLNSVVCMFRVFTEVVVLRRILLTISQELTRWRGARRPWKHLVLSADLNVRMLGGVDGVPGPRVHRDVYEQSAQHQKHMEESLQFMNRRKLAAINTYPLEEGFDRRQFLACRRQCREVFDDIMVGSRGSNPSASRVQLRACRWMSGQCLLDQST